MAHRNCGEIRVRNVIPILSRDADLDHLWNDFLGRREAAWRPAATILDGIAAGKAFGAFLKAVADKETAPAT